MMRAQIKLIKVEDLYAVGAAVVVGFCCYFLFISNFMLDGHYPRMPYLPTGLDGRGNFLIPVWNRLFYSANVPVLTPLFSLFSLGFTGLMLTRLLVRDPKPVTIFLATSFLISFPFNIAIFYYSFATHIVALSHLLAVGSVLVFIKDIKFCALISIALVFGAMATYQPAISIVFSVWGLASFFVVSNSQSLALGISKSLRCFFYLSIGALLYFITTIFFVDHHVTSSKSFLDILLGIPTVFRNAFFHLWLSQPELLRFVKILLLLPIIFLLLMSYYSNKLLNFCILTSIILATVVLTKTLYFISPTQDYFIYRYNQSLGYLYLGVILLLTNLKSCYSSPAIRRGMHVLLIISIFIFCSASLLRQHINLRGQMMDLALYNRIIYRIESLPSYDPGKTYRFVVLGDYPNFRKRMFEADGPAFDINGGAHLDDPTPHVWNVESAFKYLGSEVKVEPVLQLPSNLVEYAAELASDRNARPWPHSSSLFIHKDLIVLLLGSRD